MTHFSLCSVLEWALLGSLQGLWAGAPLLGCVLSFPINSPRTGCSQLWLGLFWRNLFNIRTCGHGQVLPDTALGIPGRPISHPRF